MFNWILALDDIENFCSVHGNNRDRRWKSVLTQQLKIKFALRDYTTKICQMLNNPTDSLIRICTQINDVTVTICVLKWRICGGHHGLIQAHVPITAYIYTFYHFNSLFCVFLSAWYSQQSGRGVYQCTRDAKHKMSVKLSSSITWEYSLAPNTRQLLTRIIVNG